VKINENNLAKVIANTEGKKVEVNIAQIKEILAITLDILANDYMPSEVMALLESKL
jgi:hypothetical protein